MREKLKQIKGVRSKFRGVISDFGSRTSHGYEKKMILVRNVRDSHGREMTDHLWFDCAKWNEHLQLGDEIEFEARVTPYWKGYYDNRQMDYKLSRPTKVRKLEPITVPLFDGPVPPSPTIQEALFE